MPVEQAETAAEILIEHEILTEEADGFDRDRVELARAADRHPVAPQIATHRCARADPCKQAILFSTEHE